MIKSKKDLLYYLEADKIAMGVENQKRPHIISRYESDIIWKFERTLRFTEYYHNCKSKGLNKIIYKLWQYRLFRMQVKTGFGIPINVFGPGFSISHLGPIVINGFAKVGKIIGDVTIANNVAIAANAVVVKSILEENTTWGGVPARKISDNGSPFPMKRRGADIAKK